VVAGAKGWNMNFSDVKDNDAVVVCNPTYIPNSIDNVTIRKCDFCGQDVWLSDSSKRYVPSDVKLYVACFQCAEPNMKKEAVMMPSDEQIMEVATKAGIPFEDVKKKISGIIKSRNMGIKYESN
jgi:hypothetical protein